MLVTNDENLALRARLIRNHAESIVEDAKILDLNNMVGFNFRMTEIEAAIGIVQLRKLRNIISKRQSDIQILEKRLGKLKGLILPFVDPANSHVYYTYPFQIDRNKIRTNKFQIAEYLRDAGVPNISTQYANIHLLPVFQQKIAYGNAGFPWNLPNARKDISYEKGICPVAEELNDHSFLHFYINDFDLSLEDLNFIASKFEEVWEKLDFHL